MLLKEKILQKQLEEDGYIIINLLEPSELKALNDCYDQLHPGKEPPEFIENIHMTIWCSDNGYKQAVKTSLESIFSPILNNFFENFRSLNHVFIIKRKGPKTTFKVHQDWNVVDESKYQSVNVWVPLHDVDKDGGALWVVKGSHKINRPVRGASYLFPDYSTHIDELEKVAISVKLKAGQAIVFYHSIIHGSPPNLVADYRKAACFTVIPKDAPLCIYFQKDESSKLERHTPKDDFMFQYNHLRTETYTTPPTSNPVVFSKPYVNKKVTASEIETIIRPKKKLWKFWGYW